MSGKSINFDDKKINKSNFYKKKKLFNLNDIEFDKILISKKESYGTKNSLKYFIGYNDDDVIIPSYINLPQMTGYVKHFDNSKTMSFKVSDNKTVAKENASCKCLSLIMLDSVIRVNKKYYPQTLLEEYKYVIRKNEEPY